MAYSQPASSSSGPTGGPVKIAYTPSKAINKQLEVHFGRNFEKAITKPMQILAQVVCASLKVVTGVYDQLHKNQTEPNAQKWRIACGVVGGVACLTAFLLYSVILGLAPLFNALLYYACVIVAVAFLALCGAAGFYFDKDPAFEQGFESNKEH